MRSFNPYNQVYLKGNGILRGVTVALPTGQVRNLLPWELELGSQNVTPRGTHPVILFFYDMFHAHMNIPSLLPNLTYHEQIVGVPFSYVTRGMLNPGPCGPFFFMPRLNLDNFLATLGGLLWWGFAKRMAHITVTQDRYTVKDSRSGATLISLDYQPTQGYQPIHRFPFFEPVQRMLNQPIVSQVPAAMGPYFVWSDFDKQWSTAGLRPLSTVVTISEEFVPGLHCGRYPVEGRTEGIDQSVLGSFELQTRWRQGLIHPTFQTPDAFTPQTV